MSHFNSQQVQIDEYVNGRVIYSRNHPAALPAQGCLYVRLLCGSLLTLCLQSREHKCVSQLQRETLLIIPPTQLGGIRINTYFLVAAVN